VQKCDVFGSVAVLQTDDVDNTSDYDSGDEDGGCGDLGRNTSRPERSVESRGGPPPSTSLQDSDDSTDTQPRLTKAKSSGIRNQAVSRSTWYDDDEDADSQNDTGVNRLMDSGLDIRLNKSDSRTDNTTEVPACVTVENQQPESVTPTCVKEPAPQKEEMVKPKKRLKNEDGRHLQRMAGTETSEHRPKEGGNEGVQKSLKVTSKTCEAQNRRTEQRTSSTSAQPHRRQLPKIVINGKACENEEGQTENSQQATGSRQTIHSNTDPNIAMVALDVRTKVATAFADADKNSDETAITRNPKVVSGSSSGPQAACRRPLPPIGKRRRAASESNAMSTPSDVHPKQQ